MGTAKDMGKYRKEKRYGSVIVEIVIEIIGCIIEAIIDSLPGHSAECPVQLAVLAFIYV